MSVLVTDPELWQKIEQGEINGLSIQGTAMIENPDFENQGASQEGGLGRAVQEAMELLLSEASRYQFSSTQINVDYLLRDRSTDFGRAFIADEDLIDVTSRENEPHVTVLYGLHTADPDKVREVIEGEPGFCDRAGQSADLRGG